MERDFKGIWIPKEVWLDNRLSALDKIILVEIDSLDANEEGCYASNQYLADFCQCTETKISTSVSKLIQLRYLEALKFDGRKRYLKSRLKKIERQTLNNLKADFKKIKGSIYTNNIYNNIDNNIYSPAKQDNIPYKEIIEYLNFKTNKHYKYSTKKTQTLIKARFNEGFTLEDFKIVIDNQTIRWLKDKKMCDYLRPETLFGTKFESYLNNIPKELTTKDLASNMDFTDFLNEGRKQ